MPLRRCQLPILTAAARTRTSTSSSLATGLSTSLSRRTSGEPYLSWTIALITSSKAIFEILPRTDGSVGFGNGERRRRAASTDPHADALGRCRRCRSGRYPACFLVAEHGDHLRAGAGRHRFYLCW